MRDFFEFTHENPDLTPSKALLKLVSTYTQQVNQQMPGGPQQGLNVQNQIPPNQRNIPNAQQAPQQHPGLPGAHMNGPQIPGGMAGLQHPGPHSGPHSTFASPAVSHMNLPNNNSPHMNLNPNMPSALQGSNLNPNQAGGHTPSPAMAHMQAPAMALQHSAQGSGASSAQPSPSVNNKRRRASAVKAEVDETGGQGPGGIPEINGTGNKVKQSPQVNKRQKGNRN